jgi:hypothetical protein
MKDSVVKHLILGLAGLVVVLVAANALGQLVIHLAFLFAGFYLLGFFLPYAIEEWTGLGHTLWVPAGFLAVFVAGMALAFGSNFIVPLVSVNYCGAPPCVNYALIIASFVLGSLAHLGALAWLGRPLDLMGEHARREKKAEKKIDVALQPDGS